MSMLTLPFYIVDSFTQTRYAGNPAGVVLPENPLSDAQMLAVAGELHLESVFAMPSADASADYTVAYFTGAKRIPLCGHDTIALATVLAQTDRLTRAGIVRLATDVGILTVRVGEDGVVVMDQALPRYGLSVPAADVAAALGLPLAEIEETGLPVQIVSTGTPFLIVPIVHRAALNALALDRAAWIAYEDSLEEFVCGVYVWTPETESANAQVHARCFCPSSGLPEDPVTGTASGAVGAYMARLGLLTPDSSGALSFRTEQGYAMGRPGTAGVRLETREGTVTRVQVSGTAVVVGEGKLWL
jgi:PhzF family phenazine biosynthesis protein